MLKKDSAVFHFVYGFPKFSVSLLTAILFSFSSSFEITEVKQIEEKKNVLELTVPINSQEGFTEGEIKNIKNLKTVTASI